MSVYTPVTASELDAWLTRYAVGGLAELEPIASGIENTNYFVTTERGRYVLTLYERLPAAELPFYLNLMAHLARARRRSARRPIPDRTGALFSLLNGKPAGLVERVDGAPIEHARSRALRRGRRGARAAARRVAVVPRAPDQSPRTRVVAAGRARRQAVSRRAQAALLDAEIRFQTGFGRVKLPKGAIHGDLFCDNVLFAGDRVAGIIDFGFAATDFFAYDLAITVNDWCVDADGALDRPLATRAWSRRTMRCVRSTRGRARSVADAAARRRAALLAVAPVRPPPAAARASSRTRTIRRISSASCAIARPARAAGRWQAPQGHERRSARLRVHALSGAAGHRRGCARLHDVQAASRAVGRAGARLFPRAAAAERAFRTSAP